ncbi:MAG: KpsF/GutQ family sugar-phosphate isomerase [bacterium]
MEKVEGIFQKNVLKKQSNLSLNIKNELISVLLNESEAINYVANNLPDESEILVQKIINASGRIVFSGMGKSGHVGKKLVATFVSLGIPSIFLHPAEALHGDIGLIQPGDFLIALSKSGTGSELEIIISVLHSQNIKSCLICCGEGKLSSLVDMRVVLPFKKEACELNLAPTSSSTLMMAFGDALAVVVSKINNFTKNDFARFHPAGALGKRLLLTINSFMYSGKSLPLVNQNDSFIDLVLKITSKKLGTGIVTDDQQNLLGIITDGDLRRACAEGKKVFDNTAGDIMHENPKTIQAGSLALHALKIMEDFNITSLVVLQGQKVVGLVHIHDLVKAGIKE